MPLAPSMPDSASPSTLSSIFSGSKSRCFRMGRSDISGNPSSLVLTAVQSDAALVDGLPYRHGFCVWSSAISVQSSRVRPGTRWNSRTLWATSVVPCDRAVEAMSRSFPPMTLPCRSLVNSFDASWYFSTAAERAARSAKRKDLFARIERLNAGRTDLPPSDEQIARWTREDRDSDHGRDGAPLASACEAGGSR